MTASRIELQDRDEISDSLNRYIDWSPRHVPGTLGFHIGDHSDGLTLPLTCEELGELLDDIDTGRECYACADDPRFPDHTDRFFDWSDTDPTDDTLMLIIGHADGAVSLRLHSSEFATLSPAIRATLP